MTEKNIYISLQKDTSTNTNKKVANKQIEIEIETETDLSMMALDQATDRNRLRQTVNRLHQKSRNPQQ